MTVKFFSQFIDAAMCREMSFGSAEKPADVTALLAFLLEHFGEPMRRVLLNRDGSDIHEDAFVLVNGQHLRVLNGLQTQLQDTDTVSLLQITEAG